MDNHSSLVQSLEEMNERLTHLTQYQNTSETSVTITSQEEQISKVRAGRNVSSPWG
jgi:hypothetical protein